MVYIINYAEGIGPVFDPVEQPEREHLIKKLYNVAAADYREPWDWDYETVETHPAGGRLRVGDFRVFMEIDETDRVLNVHETRHRKNAY